MAAAGLAFALTWWWLLQSYRKLSWAKFQVINDLESGLPVQLYSTEWQHLEGTKAPRRLWPPAALRAWLHGYHELGTVELIRQAAG